MTIPASCPPPVAPVPRPPAGVAGSDAPRTGAESAHTDALGGDSGDDLERLDSRLGALAERPVAEHAEAYAHLHEDLTERLRGTER